jgi:predicted dehydrogenase
VNPPDGPIRLAFLGCGFITRVHSRHLKALKGEVVASYASRDAARADAFCREFQGAGTYPSYAAAIRDPNIDAVVVAVPPKFHLDLTLQALDKGKHVLVEKPAFPRMTDYEQVRGVRDRAGRIVLVGENDHYKPLAVYLRRLLADRAVGDFLLGYFSSVVKRLKTESDWRNDETMAGGDAFFEEGIHWLHLASSLGPHIRPDTIRGFRPARAKDARGDTRAKSMLVGFQYDNGSAGALYYSREVPSFFRGLRLSKLFGREGVITFESNGLFVLVRGRGLPRVRFPGWWRDIRGYQAMYRDFVGAIRERRAPEMSLERAIEDQRLMDAIYASLK